METVEPGTIVSYFGEVAPEGWVICNGLEIINTNDKFSKLIEMNIGSINERNNYIPPNYINMKLISTNELNNAYIKETHKTYNGHLHVFNKEIIDDEYYYYYSLPKPLLLTSKNYAEWLNNCFRISSTTENINWIIKH